MHRFKGKAHILVSAFILFVALFGIAWAVSEGQPYKSGKFTLGSVSRWWNALYVAGTNIIVADGSTGDTNYTTLAVTDPTAARTITFPDVSGSVKIRSEIAHSYGQANTTWNISTVELQNSHIAAANASAAVMAILPSCTAGHIYTLTNTTGAVLTFKVSGQTGGTIANGKSATYLCNGTDVLEIWEQS